MGRDAAAMTEQVAERDLGLDERIGHPEPRQMLAHGIVPAQPPLVGEHRERRGREPLRAGSKRKDAVGRDRVLAVERADAVAFQIDDVVAANDHDGDAGDVPQAQRVLHGLIEDLRIGRAQRCRRGQQQNECE